MEYLSKFQEDLSTISDSVVNLISFKYKNKMLFSFKRRVCFENKGIWNTQNDYVSESVKAIIIVCFKAETS